VIDYFSNAVELIDKLIDSSSQLHDQLRQQVWVIVFDVERGQLDSSITVRYRHDANHLEKESLVKNMFGLSKESSDSSSHLGK
jgi:hypothetical protein